MTTDSSTSNISHTPGPYFYQRDSEGVDDLWLILAQADQSYIASISFWGGDDDPADIARKEANARLLAAAPDMFDALKEIITVFNRLDITVTDGPLFRAFRYARHAVALADGTLSYRAC